MAHFNPAVTLGFLITRHIMKKQLLLLYIPAEITGALLARLSVNYVIGDDAFLEANSPMLIRCPGIWDGGFVPYL